jgi:ribokinase
MAAPRIVVVGSSNTDLVVACERLPEPGETLLGGEFMRSAGGKGANQAVAAARAGAKVSFVGARGSDDFGAAAERGLVKEKIDVRSFLVKKRRPSGIALILIGGRDRQNVIAVAQSANDALSAVEVRRALKRSSDAGCVLCQLEVPLAAVTAAARFAKRKGIPFVLNPAPARALPRSLFKLVHTLTPNEHEARILTGSGDPRKAAALLQKMGCENVVVTLGPKGALVATPHDVAVVRAPKVRAVDTVGAGDCFSAWLAVGIADGMTLHNAAARAVRAASLAVTRRGAQAAMPYRREV